MKPILFNTEMVRAILYGRKTVTRRLIKPKYDNTQIQFIENKYGRQLVEMQNEDDVAEIVTPDGKHHRQLRAMREIVLPYKIGDILYVRETWCKGKITGEEERYYYKADCDLKYHCIWSPSIHMPKEAVRIFLRVTDVRVERLQDCGNAQAKDEGCTCCSQFARVWDSTIKKSDLAKYGWNANPWVWAIEFEKISREEAENG